MKLKKILINSVVTKRFSDNKEKRKNRIAKIKTVLKSKKKENNIETKEQEKENKN